MATTFKRAFVKSGTATTRTTVYTAGAGASLGAIIFDGQIANIDSTNKVSHFVTLEAYDTTTYNIIFKDLEIPYGISTSIPRIVLNTTGHLLSITCEDAGPNMLEIGIQIIERAP